MRKVRVRKKTMNFMMPKVSFEFRMYSANALICVLFSYDLNLRLQQHLSSSDKQSTKLVDDNASSCDEDNAESESEEQDDENLPVVIVKSSFLFVTRKLSFGNYEFRIKIKRYDS